MDKPGHESLSLANVLRDCLTPGFAIDAATADRLQQRLQRLNRLASLGTLSAGLAHEIRNALVPAKTFIDLLLEKNQDAELGEIVRRELARIDSLVDQMLKFSKPTEPAFRPVRLHQLLDHCLRLVQHELQSKAVSLERKYAAASDQVRGDDYQLEQVFVNLFVNALEAMSPHGTLSITTELSGSEAQPAALREGEDQRQLVVIVQDSGAGISPENLSRLFDTFFTTKEAGTGLGLAISRRIIQQHGGHIGAQSVPGQGAAFTISLPLL
jgi:signal transduction histidine kinase